ncbi:MAG: PEP-CTERM sorting domain-containing protein [Armatimonadetes bacterium]|nr:PEP-CTERM sorting domain-containing protein [Armatimonadota bacterium]
MNLNKKLLFGVGLLAVLPVTSSAIVWRNDISETTVLNYGAGARFQGVGKVNVGGGFGTGTFLGIGTGGQAWGISAKHVITSGETGSFTFEDGGSYAISQAIGFAGADVSVFKINGWNRSVFTPTLSTTGIFTVGANLDSAGYGGHGAEGSLGGGYGFDERRRGMQTALHSTRTASFGGESQLQLVDLFNSPTNGARPVEGFGAPGDSGSMLLTDSGQIWGVLSGGQFEQYGAFNYYAAITPTLAQSIYNVTGIDPVPEPMTLFAIAGLAGLVARRRRRA